MSDERKVSPCGDDYCFIAAFGGERATRVIQHNAAGRHRLKLLPVTCYLLPAISTNDAQKGLEKMRKRFFKALSS